MNISESDQHKINLINSLNKQRINGSFCDVEITSAIDSSKLYVHSVVLNIFSEIMSHFVRNKKTNTTSICKFDFPNELSFVQTDCFACFNEIINYLYVGEVHYSIGHEIHIKNIVFNLKIEKLIPFFTIRTSFVSNYMNGCDDFETCGIKNKSNSKVQVFTQIVKPYDTYEKSVTNVKNSGFSKQKLDSIDNKINSAVKYDEISNETSNLNYTYENKSDLFGNIDALKDVSQDALNYKSTTSLINKLEDTIIQLTQVAPNDEFYCKVTGNSVQSHSSSFKDTNVSKKKEEISSDEKMVRSTSDRINNSDGLHLLLSILEEDRKREFKYTQQADSQFSSSTDNTAGHNETTDEKIEQPKSIDENRINKYTNTTEESNKFETANEYQSKSLNEACVEKNKIRIMIKHDEKINICKENTSRGCNTESFSKNIKRVSQKINCKRKTMSKENLKKNNIFRKKVGGKDLGVNDGYICKKCKMFFDHITSLQDHMLSTHSKKFKCIACSFMTYKIKYFIDHLIQNKHEGTICSICLFQTTTNEELNKHILKHKEDTNKPFFCNNCDKRFPTKRSWSIHLPAHSNETQFLCAVCSKGFKWSQGLMNHMSTHMNEKMYLCDKCDFNTANRANLMKHTLKHYEEKAVCPYEDCKHKEIWKANFKAHLLTHSKVKRFQCELCGKSFAQAKNMGRHLESVHNPNVIELNCNKCNYLTNRLDKLKDHFKSRHETYDYTNHIEQLKENIKKWKSMIIPTRKNKHLSDPARIFPCKAMDTVNNIENSNPSTMFISNAPPLLKNNIGNIITFPVISQTENLNKNRIGSVEKNTIFMNLQDSKKIIDSETTQIIKSSPKLNIKMTNKRKKHNTSDNFKVSKRKRKSKITMQSQCKKPRQIFPLIKSVHDSDVQHSNVVGNNSSNGIINANNNKSAFGNSSHSVPIILLVSNPSKDNKIITNINNHVVGQTNENITHNIPVQNNNDFPIIQCNSTNEANSNTFNFQQIAPGSNIFKDNEQCLSENIINVNSMENNRNNDTELQNFIENGAANYLKVNQEIACKGHAIHSSDIPNSLLQHPTTPTGNYFDVLDESTGELLLLSRKYINNPFLDEETGELSVFEIPSSFINYIENIANDAEPPLPDVPLEPMNENLNDDFNDFSYRDENFDLLLNETISQWPNFSQDSNNSFILNELTGELKVTTNQSHC